MSASPADLQAALARREDEMFALLREIVDINSFTANVQGCNAVADAMERAFKGVAPGLFEVERLEGSGSGDILIARTRACAKAVEGGGKQILCCGHMDTVFPPDGGFTAFDERGENVHGPGVIDMKGGLVAGLYALAALHDAGALDDVPVAFLCNADEETGSAHSARVIAAEAAKSAFALVFECGGLDGEVVTGRKGKATYHLEMEGAAGHAGNLGTAKASAVLGLAHAIIAMEDCNDAESGATVNVGLVSGGTGPNTVARRAEAQVDTRFCSAGDGRDLFQALRRAALAERVPGVTASLSVVSGRPAWERSDGNARLFEVARQAGGELGLTVLDGFRGGVSDANLLGASGVPCLDGMGPVGEFDHSEREYMVRDSLPRRAALAALTLARAWERWTDNDLFAEPEA